MAEKNNEHSNRPDKLSLFTYLGIQSKPMKIVLYSITAFIILFAIYLFHMSVKKLKRIKSRDLRRSKAEHDTYCITSVYIFRWMQVELIFIILLAVSTLTVLCLEDIDFILFQDLVLLVFRPIINMSMMCYLQVYLFMTAEQIIMR